MGTTSTIKFYKTYGEKELAIASIYQQYGGYVDGVGYELAEFLSSTQLVDGFNSEHSAGGYANGIDCLAAQFIAKYKGGIGGLYMTNPEDEQEYNYQVRLIGNKINIKVKDFDGTPEELLNYNE